MIVAREKSQKIAERVVTLPSRAELIDNLRALIRAIENDWEEDLVLGIRDLREMLGPDPVTWNTETGEMDDSRIFEELTSDTYVNVRSSTIPLRARPSDPLQAVAVSATLVFETTDLHDAQERISEMAFGRKLKELPGVSIWIDGESGVVDVESLGN